MKPVLILQHLHADGPGYLGSWLAARGHAFDLRNTAASQAFPEDMQQHSALAILGGEMSANDPLPSLRRAEALVRQALRSNLPMLGHCLGGQLMARALGAAVRTAPMAEVGWHELRAHPGPQALSWFGPDATHKVFQWHYECFDLPPGATLLASSQGDLAAGHPTQQVQQVNQAFALGPHQLAMQFHVEVDASKLQVWIDETESGNWHAQEMAVHPGVHSAPRMRADSVRLLAAQQTLADCIYAQWWAGVRD
jgi:GMP synthase (glutamine-hydrolysing)